MAAKKRVTKRRASLEDHLAALGDLREDPDSEATLEALRKALRGSQNVLVGKAAKMVGELGRHDLAAEMIETFDRCLERPVEVDPGCHAKNNIAKSLLELDHGALDLFSRGMRHVQLEGSWGGPVDTAVELRANCALGFSQGGGAALDLLPLLLDAGLPVRLAAVRGLGATGTPAAEAALRLQALRGDPELEVITECVAELLHMSPRGSLDFVEELLSGADPERKSAIALGLGESRLEGAVEILMRLLDEAYEADLRRTLLLALVTSRSEEALALLVAMVGGEDSRSASEALEALGVLRGEEKLRRRVLEALERSPHEEILQKRFRREFG